MAIEGGDGKYGFLRWLMKEKPTLCMIGIPLASIYEYERWILEGETHL